MIPPPLLQAIDAFEQRDRGIPQAHMAAQLVSELRDALKTEKAERHWPYRAARMDKGRDVWWPESSAGDGMVIGDQIPGDEATAELCARCCNVAYKHALEDVLALLKEQGIDVSKALASLAA